MPEPPATQVVTGADDDGRHRVRQLVVGALGWLLWAGLIVWLALHASPDAVDVATFLATVVVTVALLAVLTALALRPAVMRQRARAPAIEAAAAVAPAPGSGLVGEITVEGSEGVRSYAAVEEARR
jgi:hypothetical protein